MLLMAVAALLTGACGTNDTSSLPTVPTLDEQGADGFAAVTVGRDHTCALDLAGHAYCWGSDADGQLGHPPTALCDTTPRGACSLSAEPVASPVAFRQISAGARHTCAVSLTNAAYCWGSNADGALGIVTTIPAPGGAVAVPQPVVGGIAFATISAGYSHTCGVAIDGTAYCWGRNDRGQLGTGDTLSRSVPTPVATAERFVRISAGQERTCGLTVAGAALCWGNIWLYRDHGFEYSRLQTTPLMVPGAQHFDELSVGTFTTCGVSSQAAYCWEANPHGEMGDGTTVGNTAPTPVAGDLRFTSVSAGIIQTCGVTVDQEAYCWGNDSFGQLGVSPSTLSSRCASSSLACSEVPVQVIGWRHFVSVQTGLGNHSCGVTTDSNIYCWGLGQSGQLGFGGLVTATSQPLRVAIALR
jgi:alpha-tubulin suppressor-like RCC1 family protein